LGDIEPGKLGYTHCHEHIFTCRIEGVNLPGRLIVDSWSRSKKEAGDYKEKGGEAIVDVQPFGAGRNAGFLYRLSRKTGVHVIGSTGLHKTYFYPDNFWSYKADSDELARLFISEINEGMYAYDPVDPFRKRSDIPAGIIKIATDENGLTPYYTTVFKAAAQAHRATGVPIITHTELSQHGLEQVEFLLAAGVRPSSIIISHLDRIIDAERDARIAELGVFLEYDTIARFKYHSDEDEVGLIKEMVERGYGDRILLGLDTTRDRLRAYDGEIGLDYILTSFMPMLGMGGLDRPVIDGFMTENPRRALVFTDSPGA
jgi:phosphotriesterase-related protein